MTDEEEKLPDKQIKPQSLKKNFSYQIIYQVVILIIPFITVPFITRRLGDYNLGNYSYVSSIASYFVTFSALGISFHGVRLIATCRDDSNRLRHSFWSLYITHFIISMITMIFYVVMCLFLKDSSDLFWIESLYVLSAAFDITWLYTGLERFKGVVILNLFIKILTTALIFIFIKGKDDIDIYVWIEAGSVLLSQLILFPWAIKHIKPIRVTVRECLAHIKPMLVFFIGSVAVALYTTFDKTLLGIEATKESVAYYAYADRIISIPRSIMAVVTVVTTPRACALLEQNKVEEAGKYVHFSLLFVTFLGIGSFAGIMALGQQLAVVYYGADFAESGNMMLLMSPLPYIVLIGTIARQEYIIPMHYDTKAQVILIVSAIVNLGISAVLIPLVGPYGAIYGTWAAEFLGTFLDVFYARKILRPLDILRTFIPFAIFGAVMYIVLYFLQKDVWDYSISHLISLIFIGLFIYCFLSLLFFLFVSPDKKEFKILLKKTLVFKKSKRNNNTTPEEAAESKNKTS